MAETIITKPNTRPDFFSLSDPGTGLSFEGAVIDGEQTVDEKVTYDNLTVRGRAFFREGVDVLRLSVEGEASFLSYVTCDEFAVRGMAVLKNKLVCLAAGFFGNTECFGSIHSDRISVTQQLKARGKINALGINVSGKLHCGGRISTDTLTVTGSVTAKGHVHAINVRILANGTVNNFTEIRSDIVTCDSKMPDPPDYALICDTIDCDTALLRYAKVDYVFCEKCRIGTGSVVRVLECHEEPLIDPGARVEKIVRF
ncbi:MAG: hypothetical protein ILO53_02795 [Clostridia bacterium]|nr:hypothetical protein [Clostridia bacterium]